jgi:hypothetical protein
VGVHEFGGPGRTRNQQTGRYDAGGKALPLDAPALDHESALTQMTCVLPDQCRRS